jgi:hypothetical protein
MFLAALRLAVPKMTPLSRPSLSKLPRQATALRLASMLPAVPLNKALTLSNLSLHRMLFEAMGDEPDLGEIMTSATVQFGINRGIGQLLNVQDCLPDVQIFE